MERYYYLIYSLFFAALLVGALTLRRDLIKFTYSAVLFGIVAGPISQLMYLHDYWRPLTLLGIGRVSVEDSIFGASIFGLAFVLYPLLKRRSLIVPEVMASIQHKRFFACLGLTALMLGIMNLAGINTVISTAISFTVLWLVISFIRRDLFIPGLFTGSSFVIIAAAVYWLGFSIVSTEPLHSAWLLDGQPLGVAIAGKIPLTELLWFFAVGSFLSVFDVYTSGKRFQPIGLRSVNLASRSSRDGTPDSM